MRDTYETFRNNIREIGVLESVQALLDWDQETHMPPNGLAARAEQMALLAETAHRRLTDPRLGELLGRLEGRTDDSAAATNVREIRRRHDRAVKVPAELVARIARVSSLAKDAWQKARAESKYPLFAPHLAELLALKREVAERIGFFDEPYDALLDEYEPGIRTRDVAAVFADLRGPLADFVRRLMGAPRPPDDSVIHRHFPRNAQEPLARRLAEAIGFDFKSGRLDVSAHPFCSAMSSGDVRMTTRYHEDFLSPSLFGVLHEAGHGLYEQGLPAQHLFTPAGQAASLGIHESQSRTWENLVGRGRAFWEYAYPLAREQFPAVLGDVPAEAFVAAVNRVQPSLIRVEADEVTYNLHIILRFELEREMMNGRLAVNDIPTRWNQMMKTYLDVTPPDDREGCLQDIHWSLGAFGYFPTYALGNLYAAQFFEAAEHEISDLKTCIRRGEFRPLLDWLRAKIHVHGQRYRAAELVAGVTGRPLSVRPFLEYLHGKFEPIYGL